GQPLRERRDAFQSSPIAFDGAHEHANAPHPLTLLRARRQWPRRRATAEKCDEFPPPHGTYPKAKDHDLMIALCIAAKSGHSSPLRVKSRHLERCWPMSAKCHERLRAIAALRPNYSITSSALPSRVGATSRPIVLAVCRLMTSSNLLGCSTGRSPGFSPLRMR